MGPWDLLLKFTYQEYRKQLTDLEHKYSNIFSFSPQPVCVVMCPDMVIVDASIITNHTTGWELLVFTQSFI